MRLSSANVTCFVSICEITWLDMCNQAPSILVDTTKSISAFQKKKIILLIISLWDHHVYLLRQSFRSVQTHQKLCRNKCTWCSYKLIINILNSPLCKITKISSFFFLVHFVTGYHFYRIVRWPSKCSNHAYTLVRRFSFSAVHRRKIWRFEFFLPVSNRWLWQYECPRVGEFSLTWANV